MEKRESFCLFCSLGCKFAMNVDHGVALSPEFCADGNMSEGRLCPKGLYAIELLEHPMRVAAPRIKENGKFREASWAESLHSLAARIAEVKSKYGAQSVGIIVDPNHTNEEILAARELAGVIGTDNLACSFAPNDWELLSSSVPVFAGNCEDLEDVNCSLIVGDAFVTHPVLAKRVIDAKYKARGNSIIVIDPRRSNTAWYASTHLQTRPGSEALLLAGLLKSLLRSSPGKEKDIKDKLEKISDGVITKATGISAAQMAAAAKAFNSAEKGLIVFCPGLRGVSDIGLVASLCELLANSAEGEKGFMPLFTFGNAVGAYRVNSRGGWKTLPQLIEEMSLGRIKMLIDFGEELLSSYPSAQVLDGLKQLEFFATSSLFALETENLAQLILPGSSFVEKSGTVDFFDGRREHLKPVLGPSWASKPDLDIICELSHELGTPVDRGKIEKEAGSLEEKGMKGREGKPDMDRLVERLQDLVDGSAAGSQEYPYLLVSGGATGHFADGSITGQMKWAREMFPAPFIEVSAEDAREMQVNNGDEVLVSSASGEVTLPVDITDRLPKGVASVPSYSAEARSIFEWKITPEGGFETAPGRVSISKR